MIKIAYIFTPIEFGGAERVNLQFLKNVDRQLFAINPILFVRPWEDDNLTMRLIKDADYSISEIPVALRPRSKGKDFHRLTRCFMHMYRILSMGKFDLVHTHGYMADIICVPICRILKIPQICTCHGYISNDRNLKLYNNLDKFMIRFCKRIITVSHEIQNELVKSGIAESKIIVIQNAVKIAYNEGTSTALRDNKRRLLSIKDEFVMGYVGRLSEEKGVQFLIEAGSVLKERIKSFKIMIIGDGPRKKYLENMVREKGLEQEIIFTGFQANIEDYLPALDVFVLPSLTEGTPMALLEAMSMKIPIVATAVGGVPKVIKHGINGLLVTPCDYKEISEAILLIKNDPSLKDRLIIEAYKTIEKSFNIDEWCKKIEKEYSQL